MGKSKSVIHCKILKHQIDSARVRTYQGEKYVTLNADSVITLI